MRKVNTKCFEDTWKYKSCSALILSFWTIAPSSWLQYNRASNPLHRSNGWNLELSGLMAHFTPCALSLITSLSFCALCQNTSSLVPSWLSNWGPSVRLPMKVLPLSHTWCLSDFKILNVTQYPLLISYNTTIYVTLYIGPTAGIFRIHGSIHV